MTYTFKLARRLAASPVAGLLVLSSALAACSTDSTAPTDLADSNWRDRTDLAVSISPTTLNLAIHEAARFSGRIHTPLGDSVSAPVIWTATGGTIDSTGAYVAGATAGTYYVVAMNAAGTIADTASVTIAAATPSSDSTPTPGSEPTPEPTPTPAPTPAPTLDHVVLKPTVVALLTAGTKQLAAYGMLSNGDSVAVAVTYSATGGTITSSGLYTAGITAGTYRVIAKTSSGLADTTAVTLTSPAPVVPVPSPSVGHGIPMGQFGLMSANVVPGPFTLSLDGQSASTIISRINDARSKGVRLFLAMTGGSHTNYLTNGVFDRAKWNAKMETFNTAAIKSAIAAGVTDGTVLGASVMDEPHVTGYGDGNTWGPTGTMTKVRVDSLCGYVKAIFPTLPVGVVHRHDVFEPTKSYRTCEFLISQYSSRIGTVEAFRDAGLALAQRDGMKIAFSMNILNGGTQDKDGTWDCAGTGGLGQYAPNCAMTPAQIREWGKVLGSAGCALMMWQYDAVFAAKAENKQAFSDVAAHLASLPAKSCTK